jgi:predicted RNase H-like HicB family nuclease
MRIEIEQEPDGRWLGEIPDLPGVLAYGGNREEALKHGRAISPPAWPGISCDR